MPSAGGVVAAALVILFCGAGDGAARRVRSISLALQPFGCGGGTVLGHERAQTFARLSSRRRASGGPPAKFPVDDAGPSLPLVARLRGGRAEEMVLARDARGADAHEEDAFDDEDEAAVEAELYEVDDDVVQKRRGEALAEDSEDLEDERIAESEVIRLAEGAREKFEEAEVLVHADDIAAARAAHAKAVELLDQAQGLGATLEARQDERARLHAALHAGDGVVNRWLRGEYRQDPWNREAFRRFELLLAGKSSVRIVYIERERDAIYLDVHP